MQYWLYHKVPENIFGNTIYPLNQLKVVNPLLYESAVKKYKGRERLLEKHIPNLNCLWNDVIFLLAVHPSELNTAIENAGLPSPKSFGYRYFKIELSMLNLRDSGVYIQYTDRGEKFSSFDLNKMKEYATLPQAQIEYYERMKMVGNYYLICPFITHILYKGTINIEGLEIITL